VNSVTRSSATRTKSSKSERTRSRVACETEGPGPATARPTRRARSQSTTSGVLIVPSRYRGRVRCGLRGLTGALPATESRRLNQVSEDGKGQGENRDADRRDRHVVGPRRGRFRNGGLTGRGRGGRLCQCGNRGQNHSEYRHRDYRDEHTTHHGPTQNGAMVPQGSPRSGRFASAQPIENPWTSARSGEALSQAHARETRKRPRFRGLTVATAVLNSS
jgi:hypothetical protein